MPEDTPTEFNRRASDSLPHLTILMDIRTEVQAIRSELVEFKRDVNKAFPKDEEGHPDYDGHRRTHIKQNKHDEKFDEYKTDVTKRILAWIATGSLGVIVLAVLDYIFIRRGGA